MSALPDGIPERSRPTRVAGYPPGLGRGSFWRSVVVLALSILLHAIAVLGLFSLYGREGATGELSEGAAQPVGVELVVLGGVAQPHPSPPQAPPSISNSAPKTIESTDRPLRAGRVRQLERARPDRPTPANPLVMRRAGPGGKLDLRLLPQDLLDEPSRTVAPRRVPAADRRRRVDREFSDEERVGRRVRRFFERRRAEQRVDAGEVHPVLYDLVRESEQRFTISEVVAARLDSAPGPTSQIGRWLNSWLGGWAKQAGAYGAARWPDAERLPHGPRERGTTMLDGYDEIREQVTRSLSGSACLLCVDLGRSGDPRVEITRSSGHPRHDRLARRALARAISRVAWPDDAAPVRACYRFRLEVGRLPPLPVVGCAFDESVPRIGPCFYPLKKYVNTRVKLVRVSPTQQGREKKSL